MGSAARAAGASVCSLRAPSVHELCVNRKTRRTSSLIEDSTMDSNEGINDYGIERGREPNFVLPSVPKKKAKSRIAVSADNSPVLSRKMRLHDDVAKRSVHHPKLLIPNMDKFDVTIECPDGEIFQASVFKVWTAFQLSWKLSHVKGMAEKIALIVQEKITQLHLVRSIEDHECVHDITQNWAPGSNNALTMSEDYTKYELFHKPTNYLPLELLDIKYGSIVEEVEDTKETESTRHNIFSFMVKADTAVDLHHWILVKDFDKKSWTHKYLRIKDSVMYLCENETQESEEWTVLYGAKNAHLYRCLDEFKNVHKPPFKHCFCVIPTVVSKWKQIKCFSVQSNQLLLGWITGFRLAKYGQQLFRNFCEAMTKEENLCRANSSHQSIFFHRGRRSSENGHLEDDDKATLDFSGNNARIISDPFERLQIHNQLGFEIPRPPKRRSETFSPQTFRRAILSQKVWYQGKVKREHAILKLKNNGMKEGMFLVRESSSCHGNLVLSVVRKGKIVHHQIFQETTPEGKTMYGMQHGPQFDSLEHFIEAYNSGAVEVDFILKKPCPPT